MFLGDFVQQLAAKLHYESVPLPFESERLWHELFYDLKRAGAPEQPEFLARLRFDWDGPSPKSQELSEFLHALHWTASVDVRNPHFDRINLPVEIADAWLQDVEKLSTPERKFLEYAVRRAEEKFRVSTQV